MKKLLIFSLIIMFCFSIYFFVPVASLAKAEEANSKQEITLIYNKKNFKINLQKYIIKSKNFIIIRDSQKYGRAGTLSDKLHTIKTFTDLGQTYESAFNFVCKGINKDIEKIAKDTNKKPLDAKIKFNPYNNSFRISKEKSGTFLNNEDIYKTIYNALENGETSAALKPEIVFPKFTREDLKKATAFRADFSTEFHSSSENRKHNIEIALKAINGKCIMPGELFSFNKATGRRIEKNGYKEARIIKNGMYTEDFGGGVCQVSTTLYNAALLAGLEIVQSRGHSIPASYVPSGLDAMVTDFSSDLVIKNNTALPVFIKTIFSENKAKIMFYGKSLGEFHYKLHSEVIEEYIDKPDEIILDIKKEHADKVKYKGEHFVLREGFKGFKTQSYLLKYKGNELISSTKIRTTKYASINRIIIEGTLEK